MPAFLKLPLTALSQPYNYPAPSWWIWILIAISFALGWTAHEIGYRMSAPSLRARLALSSQYPPCADAAIAADHDFPPQARSQPPTTEPI